MIRERGNSLIKREREKENTVELKCLDDDEKKNDRLMNDVYLHHWDQD